MKIVIWTHMLGGGGAERVLTTLAAALSEKRVDVTFVLHHSNNAYEHELPADVKIKIIKNKFRGLGVAQKFVGLLNFICFLKRHKADAVITTGYAFNLAAIIATKLARMKVPVIVRETSTPSEQIKYAKSAIKKIGIRLAVKSYAYADKVIVPCNAVKKDIEKISPKAALKTKVIPNPLNIEEIKIKLKEPLSDGLEEKEFILAVGRLIPLKGFDNLVRAWALSKVKQELVILGEGPEEEKLKSLAKEYGLEKKLHLKGFDPNPYKYMAKAKLFVLSSLFEGMPNVLLQAMACKCPVVSTDCPGASREILRSGELGELMPINDVGAMASLIKRSAGNNNRVEDAYQSLSKHGFTEVADSYIKTIVSLRSGDI